MSVRVRLTRVGSKKNPIWRVVVADQRSPRDGRSIETIGQYNPQTEPSTIVLDRERLDHWLERGAVPTNTVKKLMRAPAAEAAAPEAPVEPEPAAESEPEAAAEPEPEPEAQAAEADAPAESDKG
ncbi:MAG TPA: 30S ribosomal protein S16 [Thermoleophilaceae bacterium]|nr:30S ribosomal protein S16 [Thermoleophilaceae bacterium]